MMEVLPMHELSRAAVEDFFVQTFDVDKVFSSVKRADYLFLYYIEHCSKSSQHESGAYLWELAEMMNMSIPDISKAVTRLHDKGYVEWKTNAEKSKTYVELTKTAHRLMEEERDYMKRCFDEIEAEIDTAELSAMIKTMRKVGEIIKKNRA